MVVLTVLSPSLGLDPVLIAGVGLWAMTLYLALSSISDRTVTTLQHWLSTLASSTNSLKRRQGTDPQNISQLAFWASLLSIIPFVGAGALCYLLCVWGLGTSWAFSFGLMGALISGVYELGRRSTESLD